MKGKADGKFDSDGTDRPETSGMLDANLLKKGEDFDKLPDTWVIFITEMMLWKKDCHSIRLSGAF